MNPTESTSKSNETAPTATYTAKKFPPLCPAVISRLTDERIASLSVKWAETAVHYFDKYEERFAEVQRLAKKAKDNAERQEAKDREEEENDEPTNPGQERAPTRVSGLWISEETYREVEAEVANGGSYSIQFPGDSFRTRFRKVDDELRAFEPKYPDGRIVMSQNRHRQLAMTEDNVMSLRAAMAMCYTDKPEEMAQAIGGMRLVEAKATAVATSSMDGMLRILLFGLASRLARDHPDTVRIEFDNHGVIFGWQEGRENDEIVQDIKEMLRQLN
jgi:hypothetical protein